MKQFNNLTKGFLKENPVFVLLLGMCPTLGVTTTAQNGLGMGLATTFVLVMSNLVVSLNTSAFVFDSALNEQLEYLNTTDFNFTLNSALYENNTIYLANTIANTLFIWNIRVTTTKTAPPTLRKLALLT